MKSKLENIGWQEWVKLPDLAVPAIKAKIDTGAKTSSLHAFNIETKKINQIDHVCFMVHPIQGNNTLEIPCCVPIIDFRGVMSSNGSIEERFVINTTLILGRKKSTIELTLSNREPLRYRMILGREALRGQAIIDPSKSLITRKYTKKQIRKLYGVE